MKRKITIEIISGLLIGLLVYASLSKILAYPVFVAQLHTHPLLKPFAGFLAWAVPVVELGVAICLFMPGTRKTGFIEASVLMSIFTLYIAGMLLFDSHLPCSCGGVLKQLSWKQHLVFNIFFTMLTFTGWQLEKGTHLTESDIVVSAPP